MYSRIMFGFFIRTNPPLEILIITPNKIENLHLYRSTYILIWLLLFNHISANALSGDNAIDGYWLNEELNTVVHIYTANGELHGKIVWLEDNQGNNGGPQLDVNNKDVSLRSRAIVGMHILSGFQYKNGTWKKGKMYSFKHGRYYNASLRIDASGNLQWKGYYGILVFLSRTKKWVRVKDLSTYQLEVK